MNGRVAANFGAWRPCRQTMCAAGRPRSTTSREYLLGDGGRNVTGSVLTIDAGNSV